MAGPYSFSGPVWAMSVPTFISAAMAPEIKANEKIKTLAKIKTFFIITSYF